MEIDPRDTQYPASLRDIYVALPAEARQARSSPIFPRALLQR